MRSSQEGDKYNNPSSYNGQSFKTDEEFKIDNNPMKKSVTLPKKIENKQQSYTQRPNGLPLDEEIPKKQNNNRWSNGNKNPTVVVVKS